MREEAAGKGAFVNRNIFQSILSGLSEPTQIYLFNPAMPIYSYCVSNHRDFSTWTIFGQKVDKEDVIGKEQKLVTNDPK